MRTIRRPHLVDALPSVGLVLALALPPSLASAQPAPPTLTAADGQTFDRQSSTTRAEFMAAFGPSCASQEWMWQHSLAVQADSLIASPAASDGQHLSEQDDDVQIAFVAVWGPLAAREWLAEHNAAVSRRVLASAVGNIQCPAARPQDALSSAHLSDAVDAAKQGKLPDAHGSFNAFRDLWLTTRDDIRKRSPVVADAVQGAYDQVFALLADPSRPAPAQAEYLPALQGLLKTVDNANALLAGGGPGPTAAAAAVPGAAAGPPPQVRVGNLGESVDWATRANLSSARDEFGQFQSDWDRVKDAFRQRAPAVADRVEAAIAAAETALGAAPATPPQSQYLPALQNVQKVVLAANDEVGH